MGVPPDRPVLSFVGRVDETKGVMTLVRAARRLLDQGTALHVLILGAGSAADEIRRMLGNDVTMPGAVPQETVAWALASSDLFVFPSRSETLGNVVLEAKAAGLPVVIADAEGTMQNIAHPGEDGIIVAGDDPADWVAALGTLLSDPARRSAIGRRARHVVETQVPDWLDVVTEDLLPVWQGALAESLTLRADSATQPASAEASGANERAYRTGG